MRRSAWQHTLLSLLTLAIVLALGWFSQRYRSEFDVTANDRHSLTDASVRAVQALTTPVDIIAVLGPNPAQREAVLALIERYQRIKPDIALSFVNPETDPAQARELDAAPGGELFVKSGGRQQRLQSLSERNFTGALRQLGREGERSIAFVTGHEERSPLLTTNSDWGAVRDRLSSIGLVPRELSLVSESHIDDDINVLVIAAPRRPFFPGEVDSLMDYVQGGGNLLWMMEAAPGEALQALAVEFGIDALPGKVIDTASQAVGAGSPTFVVLDRFPTHPVTAGLSSPVLLPEAIAFSVTPLAGQTLLPLLQTPESSWTETGAMQGEIQYNPDTNETSGPLLLGITIEREIAGRQQRVAIIGDADFGAAQFVGNGANQALIESLFVWLSGDTEALEFVTQPAPDAELVLNASAIVILSAFFLAVLPLSLLLIGLLVAWRRRRA
jgi:ABC-type uncharacterized transport system involved in gliding motility auxiliary subunit